MNAKPKTCKTCGKTFKALRRHQTHCSPGCRKKAHMRVVRAAAMDQPKRPQNLPEKQGFGTYLADAGFSQEKMQQNQDSYRCDVDARLPVEIVRGATWIAINEITQKLDDRGRPIAWAMNVAGKGWFARVRDSRGEFSFGPSTLSRVQNAAEAWLAYEPINKKEGESTWTGDCMMVL